MPDDHPAADLYTLDLDAWAQRQAQALRAVGNALDNDDHPGPQRTIDWNNLGNWTTNWRRGRGSAASAH